MVPDADDTPPDRSRPSTFRQTLLRVMIVQVVTLALLWLLQASFNG
jgi:hypothetical protein